MRALIFALALVAGGCSPMLYTHGVPNMAHVEPDLIRVGCPTKEGWDYLAHVEHVKTYVGLAFDDECSKGYAEAIGIRVIRIPFEPGHVYGLAGGPTQDQLQELAAIFADPALRPLAYGCLHGQDRTGVATGVRRLEMGWSRAAAYAEMLAHHFHASLVGLKRAWDAYRVQPATSVATGMGDGWSP